MIHTTRVLAAVFAALISAVAAAPVAAQQADTVDVPVGSSVVDFSKHAQSTSRAVQQRMMNGALTPMPAVLWKFTFVDSGALHLLLVHPSPENPGQQGPPPSTTVFDRRTLALREIRNDATSKTMITVDGVHITGEMPRGPGVMAPVDVTLPQPAFFAPLSDLLVESLQPKLGRVYRANLWSPGRPSSEKHLYAFVRREDVNVLGKTHHGAWVIEDRSADGKTLNGTMWVIDGEPHLVRWIFYGPDGAVTSQLDQEVAASR
jgi:hypothetical protein